MNHTLHKHLHVVCWERARQDGSNSHLLMSRCCFREAASRPCRAARTPPPALCALCAAADVKAEPRCADAFSATSAAQRGSSRTKKFFERTGVNNLAIRPPRVSWMKAVRQQRGQFGRHCSNLASLSLTA